MVVDGLRLRWFGVPQLGRVGALQFVVDVDLPVQSPITVSGAVQLLAGTSRTDANARQAWADFDADAVAVGVVRRLRLVSIESDMLPDQRGPGWLSKQFVAGTERSYELAHPPTALRSYRLTDRDNGPYRHDYLLVDLETE